MQNIEGAGTEMLEQEQSSPGKKLSFEFTGNGYDYFPIWIVNVMLTIITLGIYSAWAKVRTKRYFYLNTKIDGSSFEYHAKPIQILIARLIFFGVFVVYAVASQINQWVGWGILLIIYLAVPWLIVRAQVFNARNSSWRNIRFDFKEDSWKDAYLTFLIFPLLIPFTLGMIIPYLSFRSWRFASTNGKFGKEPFTFHSVRPGAYYQAFFSVLLISLIVSLAFAGVIIFLMILFVGVGNIGIWQLVLVSLPLSLYFVFVPGYRVMTRNVSLNGLALADHTFESTLRLWPLIWLYIGNSIAIIVSVGFLTPWARVRLSRYLAAHLALIAADNLDSFLQIEKTKASASGDAATDLMDTDIGGL